MTAAATDVVNIETKVTPIWEQIRQKKRILYFGKKSILGRTRLLIFMRSGVTSITLTRKNSVKELLKSVTK